MKRFWESAWMPWLVIGLAVLLRAWKLGEWSLWEDEETTIYFSQNVAKPFPRFFPVFFVTLREWFQLTGLSVVAGRALAAAIGVVGVGVTYEVCRRLVSRSAGLWAALLLTLNLGHMFWSQSIRYFGLVFVFEVLALYWFFVGFERRKPWLLLASNAAFGLALWTHFSGVLLAPVFVGYLMLAPFLKPNEPDARRLYGAPAYATFFVPFGLVLAIFAKNVSAFRSFMSVMSLPQGHDPVHLIITASAYFGLPVLGLALLAPLVRDAAPRRVLVMLACCAGIPVAELVVMAQLKLADVTWYYGIIALFGFVALSGLTLSSLSDRGCIRTSRALGFAAIAYAIVHLGAYYTVMHGDRPRWREAAEHLRSTAGIDFMNAENPAVFANVPGVVAFYLGVPPSATMSDRMVLMLPAQPPAQPPRSQQWYVVEAGHSTVDLRKWLDQRCRLEATFPAKTGPRDRTIDVYRYAAASTHVASNDQSSDKAPKE